VVQSAQSAVGQVIGTVYHESPRLACKERLGRVHDRPGRIRSRITIRRWEAAGSDSPEREQPKGLIPNESSMA
jgi:hypothetical protein